MNGSNQPILCLGEFMFTDEQNPFFGRFLTISDLRLDRHKQEFPEMKLILNHIKVF